MFSELCGTDYLNEIDPSVILLVRGSRAAVVRCGWWHYI